jgi:glutathione reductase (NADPH)
VTDFDADLFVIGGGSGGVRAARIAAGYGARVALAEEYRMGGTCVIRGCVPKKLYVLAGRFADDFEDAAGFGWSVPKPAFSWSKLVAMKEAEISRLSGIYRKTIEQAGVQIYECRATLEGPNQVRLATGLKLTARHILVATGGQPEFRPRIPGLDLAISSNEIFDLPVFPKRLLCVGAGYIALEFASLFCRLGAAVTVAYRGREVLRGFDVDMRKGLTEILEGDGVSLRPLVLPTAIERVEDGLRVALSDGTSLEVDQVLIATGRHPATRGLGLEEAGVELQSDGEVVVDRFSTSTVPSIHAVGDVTNRVNLTPVAIREGHALADTLFGGKPTAVDHACIASAVFTTPEIGTVGLTEAQARERYGIVDIYKTSFRPIKATLSGRTDRTVMKIVVDGTTDRVLGVHILGHEAGEMAQLVAIAVRMGATKSDFDSTMAVHPTAAEELVTLRTRTARYEQASTAQPSLAVSRAGA